MTLQSSQRLPELLFYTKKSYRILQLQFYKGTHPPYTIHPHTCAHYTTSREFSIQNPILHVEDKELFEYYYWCESRIQKRNSMHRRQGDLLEMHPCVLQDLPRTFQTFQSFQTFQTFQSFQSFQTFQTFQSSSLSRHSSHSRHSRNIPDIPVIHDLSASPGNSTKFQYLQGIHPTTAFSN